MNGGGGTHAKNNSLLQARGAATLAAVVLWCVRMQVVRAPNTCDIEGIALPDLEGYLQVWRQHGVPDALRVCDVFVGPRLYLRPEGRGYPQQALNMRHPTAVTHLPVSEHQGPELVVNNAASPGRGLWGPSPPCSQN
jgi:hypothetical protein